MQRPIKFRAWDKDSRRMHYAEDLIGPGGWVIQFHGGASRDRHPRCV
jgi:hypothetical protein